MSRVKVLNLDFTKIFSVSLLLISLLALGACNTTSSFAMFSNNAEPYMQPHMKVQERETITRVAMNSPSDSQKAIEKQPVRILTARSNIVAPQDIEPAAGHPEVKEPVKAKPVQRSYKTAAYKAQNSGFAVQEAYNFNYQPTQSDNLDDIAVALNGCDVGGGVVSYQWGGNQAVGLKGAGGLKLQFTMQFQPESQKKRCGEKKGWNGLMGQSFDRMFSER